MIDFAGLILGPCMETFGEPISYQPAGRPAISLDTCGNPLLGVFEEFHTLVKFGGDMGPVETKRPVLGMRLGDLGLAKPRTGDAVTTADGRVWQVSQVEPDGVGGVKFVLKGV